MGVYVWFCNVIYDPYVLQLLTETVGLQFCSALSRDSRNYYLFIYIFLRGKVRQLLLLIIQGKICRCQLLF